ncbi:MAG: hypothetical protein M1548_00675 [Actinobacteria bacterium]|nr:hypothetical protein [Actinomycetota bacterium]
MELPERDGEEERILHSLDESECMREGDTIYCREGGKIETYPLEEGRGSISETSVVGFILGVLGVLLLPLPFIGISSAILAIVFSGVGIYQSRGGIRRGFAIALSGFILGVIGIVAFVVLMARILALGGSRLY